MTYFSYIPNTTYELNGQTVIVKDICKRSGFISEYKPYTDLYDEIVINDADSLESIALAYYGSATYHWVVALVNELHDFELEFPLSQLELENLCKDKYGDDYNAVKHYINQDGLVTEYSHEYHSNYEPPPDPGGEENTPVTFYEYESALNEEKRKIKMLKPELLSEFVIQFERSFNG